MKITLVTASFNDLVHGTSNNKKTGCGINLMKPETASRYHKSGEMTSLGELTCEKCKAKIAKELIKADSKEMKALLKEEKMRAKKGMDDDGLVQLSELEVKPTSLTPPEPEPIAPEPPVVPAENVQVNTNNPAYTNDLAQFAIKKPQPEPEPPVQEDNNDDFLAQFAVNKPQEEQEDDFLAQFSIQKPAEEINTYEEDDSDDFLAQFSISAPAQDTSYEEEPAPPPVIDDISEALSAIQNNPLTSLSKEPESENLNDDILSMFSIDNSQPTEEISTETDNYINSSIIDDEESIFDSMTSDDEETESNNTSEWDIIANQLFGGESSEKQPKPSVLDDISLPEIENIASPALDDISLPEIEDIVPPVLDDISLPEIEDIAPSVLDDISLPEIEDITPPVLDDISLPEIEDITPPALDDISLPEIEDIAPPVLDDISLPEIEDTTPVADEIDVPETENTVASIPDEIPAPAPVPPVQKPAVSPVQPAPQPVVSPLVHPVPQPVVPPIQPAPQPIAPPPVQPMPQPVAPPPIQPMTQPIIPPQTSPVSAPAGMGIGQIVTVPQITGYDQNGQPMYAYMQMLLQGYDQNGQPIMMPMPAQNMMGMGMPMPVQMPVQPPQQPEYSSLNKNSRLQAVLDSLDEPVAEKDMTIGQKIAAAEAAKGSPISANVSKIATNPHTKSTSQAFISAISESKDATQSLTETQGIKPKTMVLDSIEDVLSQLGDNSLKEKKEAQAKLQQNVPVYDEFKTPSRTSSSSFSRPVPSSSRTSAPNMSDMPLTKAQQKALEKQQKIDAKFQKKMAKRK